MLARTRNTLLSVPLALVFLIPLAASLLLLVPAFGNSQGFADLLAHPQFAGALWLSFFTGTLSTTLALLFAVLIITRWSNRLATQAGAFLAMPHLALAIGLAFVLAPTGLLARLAGQVTGPGLPPQWELVQDPHGLGLVAALVLKETPFLVWALASLLQRDDLRQMFDGQMKVARSMGRGTLSIWLQVLLPQMLPRIAWPLVAVLAYGCTVVDMALVIGPAQPPTLANVIWADLNDSDATHNARGAAGVLVLSALIFALMLVIFLSRPLLKAAASLAGFAQNISPVPGRVTWTVWLVIYGVILGFLAVASISAAWSYPHLVPERFTANAWQTLVADPRPVLNSLALAVGTSAVAVTASIAWMETQSAAA